MQEVLVQMEKDLDSVNKSEVILREGPNPDEYVPFTGYSDTLSDIDHVAIICGSVGAALCVIIISVLVILKLKKN